MGNNTQNLGKDTAPTAMGALTHAPTAAAPATGIRACIAPADGALTHAPTAAAPATGIRACIAPADAIVPASPATFAARKLRARMLSTLTLIISIIAVALAINLSPVTQQQAYADLVVNVGYTGGPFYQKAYFTDDQLNSMAGSYVYEYSSIDTGQRLRKGFAYGVKISDLLNAAGIASGNVLRFHFDTTDGYTGAMDGEGETAWYASQLLTGVNGDVRRYYFPDLINVVHFEGSQVAIPDSAAVEQQLWASAKEVPSIIALRSSFNRISGANQAGIDTWNNSSEMNLAEGYRLFFGQYVPNEMQSYANATNITSVTVILGGRDGSSLPQINFGQTSISGNVGDKITLTPGLDHVMDQLVADLGIDDINYTSSDEGIFTVTKNADGTITIEITGEGTGQINASFGNSAYGQFVSTATLGVGNGGNGNGSGNGNGDGDGDGDGPGEGTGDDNGGEGPGAGDDGNGDADNGMDNPLPSNQSKGEPIVLGKGTTLAPAKIKPNTTTADTVTEQLEEAATEEGASGSEGGGSEGDGGDGSLYSLAMDPVLSVTGTKGDEFPWWLLFAGATMAVSGKRRADQFKKDKDPATN